MLVVGGPAERLRRRGVGRSVVALLLFQACVQTSAFAQAPAPTVSTAATLTVLGGAVEVLRPDGGRAAAQSGTSLSVGDRILTAASSRALVTFLDGTTVTVEPSSDVTVREMDVGGRERSRIEILITAGTVWARIANLLGGRGTVSLASNTHAAIAQDGLIGAEQRLDGSFACWTRAGTVQLVDAGGTALGQLAPGQKATASTKRLVMEDFSVHRSVVRDRRAGTCVAARRDAGRCPSRGLRAPGHRGEPGVRLPDRASSGSDLDRGGSGGLPGSVSRLSHGDRGRRRSRPGITGLVNDRTVHSREWTGTIARGQRLGGGLTQEFDVRPHRPGQ